MVFKITKGINENVLYEEDWSILLSHFESNLSLTKWKDHFSECIVDVLFFLSSLYDVVSDSLVAEQFFSGTNYTKTVPNQNDPALKSTEKYPRECIAIGETTYTDYHGNPNSTSFHYECFEKDIWWGGFVTSFIFLPGLLFWSTIAYRLGIKKWCISILLLLLIPTFPILLIAVKFIAIFYDEHKGKSDQKAETSMHSIQVWCPLIFNKIPS